MPSPDQTIRVDSAHLQPNKPGIMDLRVSAPTETIAGRVEPYMHSLPDFVQKRYRQLPARTPNVTYYELIGD